jgi:hypothetical protein
VIVGGEFRRNFFVATALPLHKKQLHIVAVHFIKLYHPTRMGEGWGEGFKGNAGNMIRLQSVAKWSWCECPGIIAIIIFVG